MEWVVRGLLALVFGAAGYLLTTGTLAQIVRKAAPEKAHALAPYDSRIGANLAQQMMINPQSSDADRKQAERLALTALRTDPTAVAAVMALGINAQERNNTRAARRLFGYAGRLSRREFITQLWAIEDAVGRGDVSGALREYDMALRTSRPAAELLFPVLSGAIADPAVRVAMTRTLSGKPAWRDGFVNYVGSQGSNPEATADLFAMLQRKGVSVSPMAQGAVINALIQEGRLDQAWSYFASIRSGVDRRRSRDPQFAATLEAPSPLDWGVVDIAGGSTSIQRGRDKNFFDFVASPSVGGALLQQIQLLPPGNYRLMGHSVNVDQPADSLPYWTVACRSDGREVGRVVVPNSTQARGIFLGWFSIPVECPVQVLTLMARPSNAISGTSGQIDRVEISPLPST